MELKTLLDSVKMRAIVDSLAKGLTELKLRLEAFGAGRLGLSAAQQAPDAAVLRLDLERRLRSADLEVPDGVAQRWIGSGFDREEGLLARTALLEALRDWGSSDRLRMGASLAHGAGLGVAAVRTVRGKGPVRVGVDIETADRVVPIRVFDRFSHPDESAGETEPIALWSLKEAVFKLGRTGTTPFREIRVSLESGSEGLRIGQAEWPSGRAIVGLLRSAEVFVAVACEI